MKKKILIIEDEVRLCEVLALNLEEKGFEVTSAYDGATGLSKAKELKPDLIILDLILPKLPGEEVCRQIRKDPAISATPVIMLTAKSPDVDTVLGKVIGANSYLVKPVRTQRLFEEINRFITEET